MQKYYNHQIKAKMNIKSNSSTNLRDHGHNLFQINLLRSYEKLVFNLFIQYTFIHPYTLFLKHVKSSWILTLCCLFEKLICRTLICLNTKSISKHVAQMDQCISVLLLHSLSKEFMRFLEISFNQVWNTVQIDSSQIHHRLRVEQLSCVKVATDGKLSILFYTESTEIAIPQFVLSDRQLQIGRLDKIVIGGCRATINPEPMLVHQAQIVIGFSLIIH